MIGYLMFGGIGDAIMNFPIIKRVQEVFNDRVRVYYVEANAEPILRLLDNVELDCIGLQDFPPLYRDITRFQACDLIFMSRLERDNDNRLNYFFAIDESWLSFVREARDRYFVNLERQYGQKIRHFDDRADVNLVRFMAEREDYYADVRSLGFDVGYNDVEIPISEKSEMWHSVHGPGEKYAVIHDSSLPCTMEDGTVVPHGTTRSWYPDRWEAVAKVLSEEHGLCVYHMTRKGQKLVEGANSHFSVIPKDADFFDYLTFISHSTIYIGTDSWPGHAAIFLNNPKFVLLKGAVGKSWDHHCRYAKIIRKGFCQACEYCSLDLSICLFGNGSKRCMDLITVEDVSDAVIELLR